MFQNATRQILFRRFTSTPLMHPKPANMSRKGLRKPVETKKQPTVVPATNFATSSSLLQALNDSRASKMAIPDIQRVLLVTRRDCGLEDLTIEMAGLCAKRGVEAFVGSEIPLEAAVCRKFPDKIKHWDPAFCHSHGSEIDLVVTLGGDGTVLYTSSLFQNRVPPIVPFHLGSLGFLTVFNHTTYQTVLKEILDGKPQHINMRMRLQADVYSKPVENASTRVNEPRYGEDEDSGLGELVFSRKVLNEVVVDRGVNSTMVNLDL
ncbi:NAD(+) kinase [Podochytrium sp. JEL0797]|nr:NAD(+) kinase [Podochytrium sp. JEL0797]